MLRVPDAMVRGFFEPLWDRYEGSVRLKTFNEMKEIQYWPLERILELQADGLHRIIQHAYETSTFYRERFDEAGVQPSDIKDVGDIKSLPILTKAHVRQHQDALLSSSFRREELYKGKTGGSTGVALEYFCDIRSTQMRNGMALFTNEWSGWRLGQPVAAVWGNPPSPRNFKERLRRFCKDRVFYLDTMALNRDSVKEFVAKWHEVKPGLLFGHSHSIFLLAEFMEDMALRLNPNGVCSTSMMLIDQEREVIERVFGTPATDRYGCEEVSLIACECEVHKGMHLNIPYKVVEFLRDDGADCAPGEDGRIVVTDLTNLGMPFIRYEVGDRGVYSDRVCECGRGLPMMESVTGRVADFLLAANGDRVAGVSLIENTLTRFTGIKQMQLVQDTRLKLDINLVPAEGYSEEVREKLFQVMYQSLGQDFEIKLYLVDQIPQEKSGKYRFAKCNIGS